MDMSHELDVDYEEAQQLINGKWVTIVSLSVFCKEDSCPFEIEPESSVSTSDLMTWQFEHRMSVLKESNV